MPCGWDNKDLTEQFDAILANSTKAFQTAEKAVEETTVFQSYIKTLQIGEDRLQNNLKLRGMPEDAEK